jgi:flagellar hook-basal body complex protein FliE
MNTAAISAVQAAVPAMTVIPMPDVATAAAPGFGQMLAQGLARVNESSAAADATLRAVAMGEPVAPHQAMLAMEQARMDLHLALQVRNRLLEGVQELMRMQL